MTDVNITDAKGFQVGDGNTQVNASTILKATLPLMEAAAKYRRSLERYEEAKKAHDDATNRAIRALSERNAAERERDEAEFFLQQVAAKP